MFAIYKIYLEKKNVSMFYQVKNKKSIYLPQTVLNYDSLDFMNSSVIFNAASSIINNYKVFN